MSAQPLSFAGVLLGHFAPAMFHPEWFDKHKLIGNAEYKAATKVIVTDQATQFNVGGMELQVFEDRFQISTQREDLHEPVRDLIRNAVELLGAIPLRAAGYNWALHAAAPDEKAWHAFGDRFAPKEFWNKHWKAHAGLQNLQMKLERTDGRAGSVNVYLEPSTTVRPGLLIKVNDHYEFDALSGEQYADFMQETWATSRTTALELIRALESNLANG